MPAYQAFGLVIEADQRIPALNGTEHATFSGRPDIVVRLAATDDGNECAAVEGNGSEGAAREENWHESVPDDAGDVLRVTKSTGGAFRFVYTDGAEFMIAPDGGRIVARWPESLSLDDAVVYLLGPVMAFVLRMRGIVCLHASAIAADDGCFAVLAPGGHGKSTVAAACAKRGLAVLTDDVLALDYRGGEFWVAPAYPIVRLWPEAVEMLFGSADALPRITPEHETWDKRFLDLTTPGFSFQPAPLPLRSIYTHRLEESDPPSFETLLTQEALVTLIGNVYSLTRPEPEQRAREFAFLELLARSVPVKRYRGQYGIERLDEQCGLLHADCLASATGATH